MKTKLPNIILLGVILFLFFGVFKVFKWLGVSFYWGPLSFSLDASIAIGSLEGILCSYIAVKKNRNPNRAFWAGFFLGPLAILYYLISKPGMNEKEKEIYEWELEKKYKKMLDEKDQKVR